MAFMNGVNTFPLDSKTSESSHSTLTKAGFAFSFHPSRCEQCGGKCCVGESGYVFVSVDEMLKIAEFLGLEFEDFTQKFVRKVGYKFSLTETLRALSNSNDFSCVFFNVGKCAIYPVRPKQCREFPFWSAYRADTLDTQTKESLQQECLGVEF